MLDAVFGRTFDRSGQRDLAIISRIEALKGRPSREGKLALGQVYSCPNNGTPAQRLAFLYTQAQCIETDDPRLKEK